MNHKKLHVYAVCVEQKKSNEIWIDSIYLTELGASRRECKIENRDPDKAAWVRRFTVRGKTMHLDGRLWLIDTNHE